MILVEILPNLYLGDSEGSKYKSQLGIESQINCQRDLKDIGTPTEYVYDIKKNIEHYELVKMYQYLLECVHFINKNVITDKSILVYCESGNRAALAGKCLNEAGYTNIYNLGGFPDWVKAGGQIESAD